MLFMLPFSLSAAGETEEQLAAQYLREGAYDKAVVLYESLFSDRPTPIIYNNYLECLFALEEYRQAIDVVNRQMEHHPEEIRYAVDLGWVQQRAGNTRRARRQLDGLIDGLTPNYRHIINLAAAFEMRGYLNRSLETLIKGRSLLGDGQPLHIRIAGIHEQLGNFREMMEEYLDYLNAGLDGADRVRGLLQDAVAHDPGFERNEALRQVLLLRIRQQPDNLLYAEMLLWLSLQQQDFHMAFRQARALDNRLRQEGAMVLEVAGLSAANESYDVASSAYRHVLEMGPEAPFYIEAQIGYLEVRFLYVVSSYQVDHKSLEAIEQEYLEALNELGYRASTVPLIRNLARMQAFYLNKADEAVLLLESMLDLPDISDRVKGECRVELADILLLHGDVWDAALLYAQVDRLFRDDPLGHEARYKNARLSYYIGEFDWAKAQLDILKAGTSRLIANDAIRLSLRIQDNIGPGQGSQPLKLFARAEQLLFMNRTDEALAVLDSLQGHYPGHQIMDDVFFLQADIMMNKGAFNAADSLLNKVVINYPRGLLTDEALFIRAGLLHYHFDNTGKAMELYQQLLLNYPGSIYSQTARNRFRKLRGDVVF